MDSFSRKEGSHTLQNNERDNHCTATAMTSHWETWCPVVIKLSKL